MPLKFAIRNLGCNIIVTTESLLNDSIDFTVILGDLCNNFCYVRYGRMHKIGGGALMLIKFGITFESVWSESVAEGYEILSCDLKLVFTILRITAVYRASYASLNCPVRIAKVLSNLCSIKIQCIILADFNFPDIE